MHVLVTVATKRKTPYSARCVRSEKGSVCLSLNMTYTCRLKINTMPPNKVLQYLLVVFIKGFVTVNDVPGHLLFAVI